MQATHCTWSVNKAPPNPWLVSTFIEMISCGHHLNLKICCACMQALHVECEQSTPQLGEGPLITTPLQAFFFLSFLPPTPGN